MIYTIIDTCEYLFYFWILDAKAIIRFWTNFFVKHSRTVHYIVMEAIYARCDAKEMRDNFQVDKSLYSTVIYRSVHVPVSLNTSLCWLIGFLFHLRLVNLNISSDKHKLPEITLIQQEGRYCRPFHPRYIAQPNDILQFIPRTKSKDIRYDCHCTLEWRQFWDEIEPHDWHVNLYEVFHYNIIII